MNPWEHRVALVLAAIAAELEFCRRGEQDAPTTVQRVRALTATVIPTLTALETDPQSGGDPPSRGGA